MALGQRQAFPGQIRALLKNELAISPSFSDTPRGSFNSAMGKSALFSPEDILSTLQVSPLLLTVVDEQDLIHGRHVVPVNFICRKKIPV